MPRDDIDSTGRYIGLGATTPGGVGDWQQDARGVWYFIQPDGTRFYNSPSMAARRAGNAGPKDSFFRDTVWDSRTGNWVRKTNWGNIMALAAGAAVGGGALQGALSAARAAPLAPSVPGSGAISAGGGAAGGAGGGAAAGAVNWGAAPSAGSLFAPPGGLVGTAGMVTAPLPPVVPNTTFGAGTLGRFLNSPAAVYGVQAGANLAGALIGSHATGRAAELQAQAAREALDFAKQEAARSRADFQPYLDLGRSAIGPMQDFLTATKPPKGAYPTPLLYPGRAYGGPVTKGQPYVVGEHQPEVFVPNQSGQIYPMSALLPRGGRMRQPSGDLYGSEALWSGPGNPDPDFPPYGGTQPRDDGPARLPRYYPGKVFNPLTDMDIADQFPHIYQGGGDEGPYPLPTPGPKPYPSGPYKPRQDFPPYDTGTEYPGGGNYPGPIYQGPEATTNAGNTGYAGGILKGDPVATLGRWVQPAPGGSRPQTLRQAGYGATQAAVASNPAHTVWMRSPTGEVRKVDPAAVQKYLARGMQVIG